MSVSRPANQTPPSRTTALGGCTNNAAAHWYEFRPLFENSAATDVPPPTMRARRAHDARTHDANTAPYRHTNIVTAAARPLDAYLSARAAAEPRVRQTKPLAPTRLRSRCT